MDLSPATVLVVHDLPDCLAVLASIMRAAGYRVVSAADGSSGFDAAEQHRPELVICHVRAAGLSGIDLCRALRAHARLRHTPVLLVSSHPPDFESTVEVFEAGADDYLEIPDDPMGLMAKATRLIQQRRAGGDPLAAEGGVLVEQVSAAETILVVEADKSIRAIVRRVLGADGYSIVEAIDPVTALAICESLDRPVDLLLSDVMMYEMSGVALADRVKRMHPYLKVLFMAGYIDDVALRHKFGPGGIGIIQKPFEPDALARAVRHMLRQES